ncbi:MAG: hypothetical protein K1000chlam2_01292 [Chlamydiae bacterium]|nr:hypothetical protein [Chlamydiota bacterium]
MKRCISVCAYFLVVIGALNWGLWGFFQFDFVAWLFGGNTAWISRVVYSLIGLSGLWCLGSIGRCCKAMCAKTGTCPTCGSGKKEGQ